MLVLSNLEQKKQADALVLSDLPATKIAEQINYNYNQLAYIAYYKAMQFEYDVAIELIQLGAYAGAVVQCLSMNAPHLIEKARQAEFTFFRNRYLQNPEEWHSIRAQKKIDLEAEWSEVRNEPYYKPESIEPCLEYEGYGLNVTEPKQ
jgi:hypothetical protein